MRQFIVLRILYSIVTLFILSMTIFTIVRLTGDPALLMAEPGARPEDLARPAAVGIRPPVAGAIHELMQNVFTGELGKSFNYRLPVSELYFQRLPNSLQLALVATVISLLVGIPAGIISAVRVNSLWDNLGKIIALLGLSIPILAGIGADSGVFRLAALAADLRHRRLAASDHARHRPGWYSASLLRLTVPVCWR